jgi:hypothetical protein
VAAAALAAARALVVLTLLAMLLPAAAADSAAQWRHGTDLAPVFARMVERTLEVPADEQVQYAQRLQAALTQAGVTLARAQYVLLVDRDPNVQAAFVYWRDDAGGWPGYFARDAGIARVDARGRLRETAAVACP